MNRKTVIILAMLVLLLSASVVSAAGKRIPGEHGRNGNNAASPIEKLGPYQGDHLYFLYLYNIDDTARAYVNNKLVAQTNFTESTLVNITNDLKKGNNVIEFELENIWIGYTYGFKIIQDNSTVIWSDECGLVTIYGCNNNDLTKGIVYDKELRLVN